MRFKLIVILLALTTFSAFAEKEEDTPEKPPKHPQWQGDVLRGLSLHADIGSPIIGLLDGKIQTYELQLDFNLYRRLFPIIEIGYAAADKTAMTGIKYDTKAPFYRVGLNFGLLTPFKEKGEVRSLKCYPFVGIRYGFSVMDYNISNVVIKDEYWGTESVGQFNKTMVYSGWIEVVGGVRVDLYKGLTMGWSVRLKTLLHTSAPDKSYVWYVPGYGKSGDASFMFNYTIGYTFYWGKDKK